MGIASTIVGALVAIIEFLLSLRFIFKFFAVNARAPFVDWLYGATASLVGPFVGIVPNLNLGGFVIDSATLIALVVYVSVGYLILQVLSRVDPQ